jgi:hypothetical protein
MVCNKRECDNRPTGCGAYFSLIDVEPRRREEQQAERGTGQLAFSDDMPARDEVPGVEAMLHGWVHLQPEYLRDVWEQVTTDNYT